MGKKLRMSYDKEGDVLDVSLGDPTSAIAEEVEDDFFVCRHPVSGEIVGFSILNFERWFKEAQEYKTLPLEGEFFAEAVVEKS
ncbi:MAG: DUF2283 domain-containing protein [Deltaproteobacteria bacterium]|nr:DUF2283 domain-containing protein [Deltaproteobacteria bacterium]